MRHNPYAPLYGEGFEASLIATCTVYGVLKLAARIASILGQMGDHELIESQAQEVKKAFRNRFVTPSGHLAGDSQSIYVAALHHNMLEPSEREIAQQRLIELLVESNYHADVVPGVLRALLPTLTQAGRLDMAPDVSRDFLDTTRL